MKKKIDKELHPLRDELINHPIYKSIQSLNDINCFMEQHVFAVWDFMSLLKQLQNLISCNDVPWRPSGHSASSRLINEIVWGEESDLNRHGIPMSHFEMYLEAMQSLGAKTDQIEKIIKEVESGKPIDLILNQSNYPNYIIDFLRFTFEVVFNQKKHVIAAVFTFGREDLIPDMFIEIIKNLNLDNDDHNSLADLVYYFERHIEVDSGEHGPMAIQMVENLCDNDNDKLEEVISYSKKALQLRINLWDGILNQIKHSKESVV